MTNNNTILNVERGHNSQLPLLPLAHHQSTGQDCQVNIKCSPHSSIEIDCIHLFSKSSFFSSLMYDSESFVETEDKKSL